MLASPQFEGILNPRRADAPVRRVSEVFPKKVTSMGSNC